MRRRTQKGLRRVFSGLLAASLCLGMLAGPVLAVGEDAGGPAAPSQALTGDRPVITLQGNAVTEYGNPTGFFELSIWVQTPESPPSNGADRFRSVSLALKFDTEILTPVDWETGAPAALDGATPYSVQLHTKKADAVSSAYAVTDQRGMLLFSANTLLDASFPQAAPVAVLRFRYDPIAHPMSVDDRDADKFVLLDTAPWSAQDGSKRSVVWLADDGEAAASAAGQSVWYESGCTQFYWYPAAPGMVNGSPDTVGKVVSALGGDGSLSTASNLLTKGTDVKAELVNGKSYAEKGADTGALSSILFYDWDDTLIGVLIVPKGADAREMVNEYVGETMLYQSSNPDLDLRGNANYASTARADNYRGRYPYAGPQPVDSTVGAVDDGARYPLTNKLDYCFLKVPMEPEYDASGADAPLPTGRWVRRTGEDGAPAVDTEYPYTHGWAVVENGRPEQTWTTLGVGELADYSADGATGAVSFTVTDGASFQLADFNFSDDDDGDGAADPLTDSVFSVKAVYRPGEDLLSSAYQYRMVDKPYYNKYNEQPAAAGGAYQVTTAFERASMQAQDGCLRGVARLREPAVRQDTTTDLRWEENAGLNIDHDLPNASMDEAEAKTKTSYAKIDVDNGEIIQFSLALSARHNKVDYSLGEAYRSNFVAANVRTASNSAQKQNGADCFVLDNYNYHVPNESDESDPYYDAVSYSDRDGTHGFVLYGTLNNIMEKATRRLEDPDEADFDRYVTWSVVKDANLRLADGGEMTAEKFIVQGVAQNILAAAQAARTSHENHDDQWWNTERDCAELTYHQLQGYLLNKGLLPDEGEAAPIDGLTWCHLHAACADASSGKPKSWDELVQKAKDSPDDLDTLTPAEIESLFHLRTDPDGTPYASTAAFKAAVTQAVQARPQGADLSWGMVQYHILHGGYPADLTAAEAEAGEAYWWYDGWNAGVGSWEALMDAADDGAADNTPVTLPDGSVDSDGRAAKLNTVKDAFDKLLGTPTDTSPWVRATHNLVKNSSGEAFGSFEDFCAALTGAWTAAQGSGEAAPDWNQVQYYLLHPTEAFPTKAVAAAEAGESYWWYDAGQKIKDLASFLTAVQNGRTAALGALTLEEINGKPLYLRAGFDGRVFDDKQAALDGTKAFLEAGGKTSNNWYVLQYFIAHGNLLPPDDYTAYKESNTYYWWVNDGTAKPVTVDSSSPDDLSTLSEAAFRAARNGNANAWTITAAQIDALLLRSGGDGGGTITDRDALPKFETAEQIRQFESLMEALVSEACAQSGNLFAPPALTWYQVQHYLIEGNYVADEAEIVDKETVYWWKEHEKLGEKTQMDQLLELMENYLSTGEDTDMRAFMTGANMGNGGLGFKTKGARGLVYMSNSTALSIGLPYSKEIADLVRDDPNYYSGGKLSLTWYQLQYFYLNHKFADAQTAKDSAASTWTPPDYVKAAASIAAFSFPTPYALPDAEERTEISEDGRTTTVTRTETALDEWSGDLRIVTTVTVSTTGTETRLTVTTVTTTVISGETGLPDTTVTTTTAEEPLTSEEVPSPPAVPDAPGEEGDAGKDDSPAGEDADSPGESVPPQEGGTGDPEQAGTPSHPDTSAEPEEAPGADGSGGSDAVLPPQEPQEDGGQGAEAAPAVSALRLKKYWGSSPYPPRSALYRRLSISLDPGPCARTLPLQAFPIQRQTTALHERLRRTTA